MFTYGVAMGGGNRYRLTAAETMGAEPGMCTVAITRTPFTPRVA
jgi:hypothetical protein